MSLLTSVSQKVMVEINDIIAHTYLTYLVKVRPNKLAKCWSPNISQTVTEDAKLLHRAMSELVRAVVVATPTTCF